MKEKEKEKGGKETKKGKRKKRKKKRKRGEREGAKVRGGRLGKLQEGIRSRFQGCDVGSYLNLFRRYQLTHQHVICTDKI